MTLFRSLVLLVALGVPLAAGGMYALSCKQCHFSRAAPSAKVSKPEPCDCCCDPPSHEQLIAAFNEGKETAKSDCPLFGGTPQRNLANVVDKNIPTDWSIEEGKHKNIKWIAAIGDKSF